MRRYSKITIISAFSLCMTLGVLIPPLHAWNVKIGTKIEAMQVKDIRGVPRDLGEFGSHKAYVFIFVTSDCPIVKKTLPKLLDLYNTYHTQDVLFVCVNVGANDTLRDVASQALEFQAPWPFVKDYEAQAAKTMINSVWEVPNQTLPEMILNSPSKNCLQARASVFPKRL
jgi:hypothetical protein